MDLEIIIFNMSSYAEWQQGIANRNYHILHQLAQDQSVKRIVAVDFLPFTFKRACRNYWENNLFGPKGKVVWRDLTTRCVKIDLPGSAEVYIFSTIESIFSHQRVIKKLNRFLKKINQPTTTRIVWSYFPMFVEYFKALKADLTVFDTVDNWLEHPSFLNYQTRLKKNYALIARQSDLIFTVAESLKEFYQNLGRTKDVHWIANGIDLAHFKESKPLTGQDLINLEKIPRPIIGYVGTIQHRVDLNLVEYLVKNNPNKSFVFIGPIWKTIKMEGLKKYPNIYLLGRKSYQIVPAYIKKFDVAIIPHHLDEFIKYTYSLKLLEYLACGRPVVTVPASGTEQFSDLIYLAKEPADFKQKIDLALKSDTIELSAKRIQSVAAEDWRFKVAAMLSLIKKKLAISN